LRSECTYGGSLDEGSKLRRDPQGGQQFGVPGHFSITIKHSKYGDGSVVVTTNYEKNDKVTEAVEKLQYRWNVKLGSRPESKFIR